MTTTWYALVSRGFRGPSSRCASTARAAYAARWSRFAGPTTQPPEGVLVAGHTARAVARAVPWRTFGEVPRVGWGDAWWTVQPCVDCGGEQDGPYERCHRCRIRRREEQERRLIADRCRRGDHDLDGGTFVRHENVPWYAGAHAGIYQIVESKCRHCGARVQHCYPGFRRGAGG